MGFNSAFEGLKWIFYERGWGGTIGIGFDWLGIGNSV
jgi:hypothetical protein